MAGGKGTLSANAGVTGTLTQVVSGDGALTKDGAGTIVLTNNGNSWAGGTFIAAGTLHWAMAACPAACQADRPSPTMARCC